MKRKAIPDPVAPAFGYVFPAIRGVQAGREYYVSMCPLRLLPKLFLFDEEELVPELILLQNWPNVVATFFRCRHILTG